MLQVERAISLQNYTVFFQILHDLQGYRAPTCVGALTPPFFFSKKCLRQYFENSWMVGFLWIR